MPYAHIRGWGKYVPPNVVTNDDLARKINTTDEWIRTRTGIAERRIAGEGETAVTMGIQAAREALQMADVDPAEVDLVIAATATPDRIFPATACMIQDAIGAQGGAFDLSAGCSGFIYALSVAAKMIEAAQVRRALVVGTEALSHITDWSDRTTCVLFGDGAGAFYLEADEEPGGLLAFELGSDGSGGHLLTGPIVGNSYTPAVAPELSRQYLVMHGRAVYRFATRVMGQAAEKALRRAGLSVEDIDLFIPHQANLRIIESAAKHLKLPMEKVYVNIHRYGNTSAASIPVACCEAVEEGRLNPNDTVVMVGFGAGLTWAAAVAQWPKEVGRRARSKPRAARSWLRNQRARLLSMRHRLGHQVDELLEAGLNLSRSKEEAQEQ